MVTLKEKAEQLYLRPFRCPSCSGVVGNTTETTLYVGAVKFERTITMCCGYCEKQIRWRPNSESFANSK